ncbi:MAG: AI-2E family transporter [Pseudomonadota bacterium]
MEPQRYTLDRLVRLTLSAAAAVGLFWLLHVLADVLVPFAVALLLAYLLDPLVTLVQRKVPGRAAAVALSLVGVTLTGLIAVAIVVPLVLGEVAHAGRLISQLVSNSTLAQTAQDRLPPDLWLAVRDLLARPDVQEMFSADNAYKLASVVGQKVLPGVWGLLSGATSLVLGLVGLTVIVLYVVFLLMDYQRVREGWQDLIPEGYRQRVVLFARDFDLAMNRYFRAQAVIAAAVGVVCAIGFTLIGLPLGILFGLFVGLLNMVPYLQIVALLPAALLAVIHALETGSNLWLVLGLTGGVFVVAQVVQDAVLVPRIMGKVTGLSPAMILLSLSVWGKLLGMLGLLIALPMTCLLLAYYRRILAGQQALSTEPAMADDGG